MFVGEKIPSGIQEYAATAQVLKTKEEIYSAMVVYGLLTYDNGMVFIPNKKLMGSYAAMMKKEKFQYTGRILAVGISYDKETKQHACKIEEL